MGNNLGFKIDFESSTDTVSVLRYYDAVEYLYSDGVSYVDFKCGKKEYWLNGERHCKTGPAVIHPDGSVECWLNGKAVTIDNVFNKKQAMWWRLKN